MTAYKSRACHGHIRHKFWGKLAVGREMRLLGQQWRRSHGRPAAGEEERRLTCSRILLKEPPKTSRSKVATTVQQNTITPIINPIICGVSSMVLAQRTRAPVFGTQVLRR